jgi:hypothetical protein
MAPTISKKRKIVTDGMRGKVAAPVKKFKRQRQYASDSDSDSGTKILPATGVNQVEQASLKSINLQDSDKDAQANVGERQFASDDDMDVSMSDSDGSDITNPSSSGESEGSQPRSKKRKRNDPDAFATSISRILSSKLSTSKRADPVLARSKTAALASQEMQDARLEAKAKHKLREEKKAELDRGRVKEVLGGDSVDIGTTLEMEKRLRKTAQRGVVKLFNAVRAAQVKGEEAEREARKAGVIGDGRRKEKANEMSKKGFLDLITGGEKAGSLLEA